MACGSPFDAFVQQPRRSASSRASSRMSTSCAGSLTTSRIAARHSFQATLRFASFSWTATCSYDAPAFRSSRTRRAFSARSARRASRFAELPMAADFRHPFECDGDVFGIKLDRAAETSGRLAREHRASGA